MNIYDSRNSLCLIDSRNRQKPSSNLRQQKFFVSYRQKSGNKLKNKSTIVEILCVLQTAENKRESDWTSTIVEILCVLQTVAVLRSAVCRSTIVEILCVLQTNQESRRDLLSTIVEILCVLQTARQYSCIQLHLRQQKFFVSYRHVAGHLSINKSTIVEILCVLQTISIYQVGCLLSTIVEILCVLQTIIFLTDTNQRSTIVEILCVLQTTRFS